VNQSANTEKQTNMSDGDGGTNLIQAWQQVLLAVFTLPALEAQRDRHLTPLIDHVWMMYLHENDDPGEHDGSPH
jgi:hypothetical protein